MTRKIDVEIGKGGKVTVEFSGFPGEDCFIEADAFRKALKELGLWAVPLWVTPKEPSEIEAELPSQTETKRKVIVS